MTEPLRCIDPLAPDQQDIEVRPCRIHPANHRQRAVCRFDSIPFQGGRPACGCPDLAPYWRCIE